MTVVSSAAPAPSTPAVHAGFFSSLGSWFSHTALPYLQSFVVSVGKDELNALVPIAKASFASLTAQELTAITTGDTKDTGHILAKVVADTAAQAKTASIQTVMTAVGVAAPAKH